MADTAGEEDVFPDVQLGFGQVITSGEKHRNDFIIRIEMDPYRQWEGESSLVVSVLVPTWKS
jgi:hypothetical protein